MWFVADVAVMENVGSFYYWDCRCIPDILMHYHLRVAILN